MRLNWLIAISAAFTLTACQSATRETKSDAGGLAYPTTRKTSQIDTYHGVKVADPYRWLEDIDSPETKAWIEAQNRLTFGYLKAIPERDNIASRLTEIWNFARRSAPFHEGKRWFWYKNDGLQNQSVLYSGDDPVSAGRVLLDPNTLSADGTIALKGTAFTADGARMAYGLSSGGSDWEEWHVLDVASGKPLDDVLKWVKFSNVAWTRDGKGFFYSRYDKPQSENALKAVNEFQKLYYHRLGKPQSDDILVYERKDQPNWGFSAEVTEDGRYLAITVNRGTETKNIFLYKDLKDKNSPIQELINEWKAEYQFFGNVGRTFYFVSDDKAARYRIVAADLDKLEDQRWRTIVTEDKDTLQSATLVGGQILAQYLQDAHSSVRRFGLDGKPRGEIFLPGLGTADGFTGKQKDRVTYFTFTSYVSPTSVYRYDFKTNRAERIHAPKIAFDPLQYETTQIFYTSKDGTRVPMFITAKKDLPRTGDHPTILYGYGGFNISMVPSFSAAIAGWLDLGGIYAVANLRGGGEYGREWHEAGTKLTKQNVFNDFIAAAEYLIAEKYTSSHRLAIRGGSNGGLLVAATELQRPDLFAAAIPEVGVLDMLRFREFTIGKAWESDYGSVQNEDEFEALRAYSPLHNVRKRIAYPATLVMTGDHDDRVFPAHSFKFAAALQAADPAGAPHLIRIDVRAGHGQGKPTAKQIAATADAYAFILKAFDKAK